MLGQVNSPGSIGADLAEAKETANSAISKANSNETEISNVKKIAETALSKAEEAISSPKVTGIKGNEETSYRTGHVNLTPANIGAASSGHTHNYAGSSSAGGAATSALACTGNSATATKATQDSTGQQINTTYIKELEASGVTITYTKGDGTTGTINVDIGVLTGSIIAQATPMEDYFKAF